MTMASPGSAPLGLARKRRLLEKHWPWVLFGGVGCGGLAVLVLAVAVGLFDALFGLGSIVRGYTPTGVLFGLGAVLLASTTFFYSLRKRWLQEHMPLGRSTLATWLWAHVYLGLGSLGLALAHAGFGAVSLVPSTGKLLLFLLLCLVGGGVAWRIIYAVVPALAARQVGNYARDASRERAEACLIEIDKIAAGRSPRFRELTAWVLERTPSPSELAHATASLGVDEQMAFSELSALAAARAGALARAREQGRYLRWLQGLRVLHVPVAFLFLLLLPIHVFFALDLPALLVAPGALSGSALGGFEPAATCRDCHRSIYEEWRLSMHAHAMTSPVMIAQTNQVAARVLAPISGNNLKEICVNCHGPIGALLTAGNTLPLPEDALSERALLDDGVSCAVCHQWQGESHTGGGGLARFQAGLEPGRLYYGPHEDAVGNAFHQSEKSPLFAEPEQLCRNCHSVQYDKNRDGRFDRGTDLVLQTLFDEWEVYRRGGGASCVDCHMPPTGRTRSADGASIPFDQDDAAPPRRVRDHGFVGVDYPLLGTTRDATRPRREALLRRAATLAVPADRVRRSPGKLELEVVIANAGTGHYLPGGFAFVRQMWLEVLVEDASGQLLAASGLLSGPAADLCDASILDDQENPMRPFVAGCRSSDPLLVNFQQMLVDRVEVARDASGAERLGLRGERLLAPAPGAKEVALQYLEGGPVPRVRPLTKRPTGTLAPGESVNFPYAFRLGGEPKRLRVRLLFRATPPYFLRTLGHDQPANEAPRLDSLIGALEVTEMSKLELSL